MKSNFIHLVPVLVAALLPARAFAATSLTSETTGATNGSSFIQSLTVEGDPSGEQSKRNSQGTIWNLEYTFNQSSSTDSTSGASILNQTSEFRGGLGERNHEVEYNFTGIFGATPSENLTQYGLEAYLSYDFVFGESPKKSDDDETSSSRQTLTPKLTLGSTRYSDVISQGRVVRRRGVTLPGVAQSLNLSQYETGLKLTYSPWDWLSAKLSGTYYFYSQDVTQFVQVLDNLGAVNAGAGAFGSSVSGFPRYEAQFGSTFYFLDTWSLEFDVNNAQSVYDGSFTQGYKGLLEKELGRHWTVSLGAEEDYSTSGPTTLALGTLEYRF